jgi:hypothetical protein
MEQVGFDLDIENLVVQVDFTYLFVLAITNGHCCHDQPLFFSLPGSSFFSETALLLKFAALFDKHNSVPPAWHSTPNENDVFFGSDVHHHEPLNRRHLIAHVAWHFSSLDHPRGRSTAAYGSRRTFVHTTVTHWAPGKIPALDGASKAFPLAPANHVDQLTHLKDVSADFLSQLKFSYIVHSHLSENGERAFPAFLEVTKRRFGGPLGLFFTEAQLHGIVAIAVNTLDLGDRARPRLNNRNRGDLTVGRK